MFNYLIDYTKQDLTGLSHLAICVMSHGQATVKLIHFDAQIDPLAGARGRETSLSGAFHVF